MRVLTTEQGTREWERARKGRVTASAIGNVLAGLGTKTRREYRDSLVLDLEGVEDFADTSPWFLHGRMYEDHARGWYNWEVQDVTAMGFVLHESYNWLGASPDGGVPAKRGGIEIKCRKTLRSYHDACIKPPSRLYLSQMQATMWVCGWEWIDYVNYWRDDATKKEQGHVRRIMRDNGRIRELEDAALLFWREVVMQYRRAHPDAPIVFPFDQQSTDHNEGDDYGI